MTSCKCQKEILKVTYMHEVWCGNKFCVFWKDGRCSGTVVRLDACGVCRSGILIELPDSFLEEQRKKTDCLLDELE